MGKEPIVDDQEVIALAEALEFRLKREPSVPEVEAAVAWATQTKIRHSLLELITRGELGLEYDERRGDWVCSSRAPIPIGRHRPT